MSGSVASLPFLPPRRILVAPDKFKGTLTSDEAARAISRGLRCVWPHSKITRLALTDGGEGFVDTMVRLTGGKLRTSMTTDAAGRPHRARWGVLGDGRTAVIGLSEASGLAHLPAQLRRAELTSNLGTGRLIAAALRAGYRRIVVGLGGSATTEGGISLAAAVGYRFLDRDGRSISLDGAGLSQLDRMELPGRKPGAKFIVATDVGNPLFGARGAACQFARQKGADARMVRRLDAGLRRLARIVKRDLGLDLAAQPGAGSAGGCGYGLMAFFGAKREEGFQLIRQAAKLDKLIRSHDLVITGEGSFDRTSLLGKAPAELGRLAHRLKKPVWALCGRAEIPVGRSPFDRLAALPADAAFSRLTPAQHAKRLEALAERIAREAMGRLVDRKR
jgi:glycerate kinase